MVTINERKRGNRKKETEKGKTKKKCFTVREGANERKEKVQWRKIWVDQGARLYTRKGYTFFEKNCFFFKSFMKN
jgi:hypothetical protein